MAASPHLETIVIGAGQAGLSMGYHLQRKGRPFLILDADQRVGEAWRRRWDSLRLFTPARYDGLDGRPYPAARDHFPTKDAFADYLEGYAADLDLPIRHGVRVDRLAREDGRLTVTAGEDRWTADNVVVAMGGFQQPAVPAFAEQLDPGIVQLHSSRYRNPEQLADGPVLVVGAGNSGAEIAMDVLRQTERPVIVAGRHTGQIPFRTQGWFGRHIGVRIVLGGVFSHVLTVRTPIGRRARPTILTRGGPLIRVRRGDLTAAGARLVGRVEGVEAGRPVLADGTALDVASVVWCTGYRHGFDWIDLPVHGELEPQHVSGVCPTQPGLYFLGLLFLDSMASEMIHGVGRDAARLAAHLDRRMRALPDRPATAAAMTRTTG